MIDLEEKVDPTDSGCDGRIHLVPRGKIRCYIHNGKFRKDTPEEHVRQRIARRPRRGVRLLQARH